MVFVLVWSWSGPGRVQALIWAEPGPCLVLVWFGLVQVWSWSSPGLILVWSWSGPGLILFGPITQSFGSAFAWALVFPVSDLSAPKKIFVKTTEKETHKIQDLLGPGLILV
ncbi:hypothetical protein NL108_011477 [Boleophthalmus pectinirostris]|nr:hypothetical protein NL108_011477 [Boleophthalmus pectinirostris]